ncbi:hypothetical protein [Proteiniphilum sp.]|uniref:hypothetical protein n=1 Tax=Proteiniphilum sp. TaxID=1926877 RepID=UPI002B1FAD84|nr:hypothetical protein [Proteiniphilum sp.]MEA4918103.1 hypothetical protein [Proteiniphilum sp.]
MKQYILILALVLGGSIPANLLAYSNDQDSTIISGKTNSGKTDQPTKRSNVTLLNASGDNLTDNIKKVFIDSIQVGINHTDSIKPKNIKNISTKQLENGDIWLYIETNNPKAKNTDKKKNQKK